MNVYMTNASKTKLYFQFEAESLADAVAKLNRKYAHGCKAEIETVVSGTLITYHNPYIGAVIFWVSNG